MSALIHYKTPLQASITPFWGLWLQGSPILVLCLISTRSQFCNSDNLLTLGINTVIIFKYILMGPICLHQWCCSQGKKNYIVSG